MKKFSKKERILEAIESRVACGRKKRKFLQANAVYLFSIASD